MVQPIAKTLTDVLNKQIADWNIIYVKLHHYHWFVKGDNFYELHAKFEQLYNEAATYMDQIAERLLSLNQMPIATIREFLQQSSITEAAGSETAQQMVQKIANDFKDLVADLKEGIKLAEREDDTPTADMLTEIRSNLEKHIWMMSSFLG